MINLLWNAPLAANLTPSCCAGRTTTWKRRLPTKQLYASDNKVLSTIYKSTYLFEEKEVSSAQWEKLYSEQATQLGVAKPP